MTDEAKRARAEYMKEWRAKNPERERQYKERYWQRKAEGAIKSNRRTTHK